MTEQPMRDRWKLPIHSLIFRMALYLVMVGALPFAAALALFFLQASARAGDEWAGLIAQSHERFVRQFARQLEAAFEAADAVASEAAARFAAAGAGADAALIGATASADQAAFAAGRSDAVGANPANAVAGSDSLLDIMRKEAVQAGEVAQMCIISSDAGSVCLRPGAETAYAEAAAESGDAGHRPVVRWDSDHKRVRFSVPIAVIGATAPAGQVDVTVDVSRPMDELFATLRSPYRYVIADDRGNPLYRRGTDPDAKTGQAAVLTGGNALQITSRSIVSLQTWEFAGGRWTFRLEVENPLRAAFADSLRNALILFVALVVLVCAGGVFIVSRSITRPLRRLRELMKRAERGDLKAYWVSNHTQEINELGQSYNQMLNRLEDLIKQVKREEALKKEAEIAALQYQLNPHFLYNTLNTIKWVAKLHRTPQISDVISALVRLLQASLGKKGDFITLREEIALIRDYMDIQRFRYGDRVQIRFDIEPVAELCLVPRLILQPLVENACIHGIEPSQRDGTITIKAWIDRDLLFCQVEDNGIGMKIDPDTGEAAGESGVWKERMSGIGLKHIREKIKLYYGPDYKMHVISKERQGTAVRLSLPIHQSEV